MDKKFDLSAGLKLAGELIVNQAKMNLLTSMKHSHGTLVNSVEYWFEDDGTLVVGSKLPYAVYRELGTGLFAKNGDGRKDVPWVYCDLDGHFWTTSGQHPQEWLRPALESGVT